MDHLLASNAGNGNVAGHGVVIGGTAQDTVLVSNTILMTGAGGNWWKRNR